MQNVRGQLCNEIGWLHNAAVEVVDSAWSAHMDENVALDITKRAQRSLRLIRREGVVICDFYLLRFEIPISNQSSPGEGSCMPYPRSASDL